jgi:hypothetical protein
MNSASSIDALRSYMKELPNQEITDSSIHQTICGLLTECWAHLNGSQDQNTYADKIYRAEKFKWKSPILTFELERHGGTVLGSTRANIHLWSVNVERGTAEIYEETYRKVGETAPAIKTKPIAEEIAQLIIDGVDSPKLKWNTSKDYVLLELAQIIPDNSFQQTVSGRRKRFKAQLEEIIAHHGWRRQDKGHKTGFARNANVQ